MLKGEEVDTGSRDVGISEAHLGSGYKRRSTSLFSTEGKKLRQHNGFARTMLVRVYYDKVRWEEAEKLDVEVMESRKTKLGADHLDVLTGMANLASTYWEQDRLSEAETLEVEVLEKSKARLGADHPNTLNRMTKLAFTWKIQSRHADALVLMERCAQA